MKTVFAVTRTKGKAWDDTKPLRSQSEWTEHAAFMNALADSGFIVLGGPLEDTRDVLLIIDAATEQEVRSKLSEDPWSETALLEIKSIQRWSVLLESRPRITL
jgi:uncharacterized protein YciI